MHHRVEAQVIAACIGVKASRPELQDFCRELEGVQTAQADLMRQFLKQWFRHWCPEHSSTNIHADTRVPKFLAPNRIAAGPPF